MAAPDNQQLQVAARALESNKLLPLILERRRKHLYKAWLIAQTPDKREQLWIAHQQTDELARAVKNAVREYIGDDARG